MGASYFAAPAFPPTITQSSVMQSSMANSSYSEYVAPKFAMDSSIAMSRAHK